MSNRQNLAINILLGVLILLAFGWVWGVFANWEEIASRPVRLAYIICDFLFVIPVGVIASIGLKRGKSWAKSLFILALGALLFDIAHGVLYLVWDNYFSIPLWMAFVLLAGTVAYTVFAVRAVMSTD